MINKKSIFILVPNSINKNDVLLESKNNQHKIYFLKGSNEIITHGEVYGLNKDKDLNSKADKSVVDNLINTVTEYSQSLADLTDNKYDKRGGAFPET